MAKKISSSDIAEDDVFGKIKKSAEDTIVIIDKLSQALTETAEAVKKSVGGAKFDSTKAIDNFVKSTKQANDLQKQAIKLEQERARATEMRSKAMSAQQKRMQEVEKTDQQRKKTTQESLKIEAEKERLAQQRIRTAEQQAKADERAANAAEREAKALKNVAPAYKELSDKSRALKNESKELAAQMLKLEAEGKRNSAEWRKLSSAYTDVTAKAKMTDAQLKKIDSTVGDNFRNVGNYRDALGGLQSALGSVGIAFGIGTIVQGASKTIVEFDQAVADLVSITGAGGDDLNYLKEQAISLGKEVEGGASAVIEGYKLIGSARPELLQNAEALNAVTESAITLSQASGLSLPDAATALTSALNQFGAPASEATRYMDALANGALLGSVEIPNAADALLKFGGVAKSSNVQIEEAVALIQLLGPSFKSAEEVGTGLRNVMLKLSAPDALPRDAQVAMKELGVDFEKVTDKSTSFAERLDAMKPLLKDEAALIKVFGSENIIAAKAALTQTDALRGLTEGMDEVGTTQVQAEARTQTLSHALIQLSGAWDELILGLTSGEGVSKILVGTLSFIAQNLGTIVGILGKVALAWGTYKALQVSLIAIEKARAFSLVDFGKKLAAQIPMTRAYRLEQVQAARAAKQSGEAVQSAGRAMTAVPWMAIIGVVIELAMSFYDAASGAAELRRQQQLTEAFEAAANKNANKRVTERTKNNDKEIAEIERKHKVNMAAAKTDKERAALDAKYLKDKEKVIKSTQRQVSGDISAVEQRKKAYKEDLKELQRLQKIRDENSWDRAKADKAFMQQQELAAKIAKKYKVEGDDSYAFGFIPIGGKDVATAQQVMQGLTARVAAADEKLEIYRGELDAVTESTKDATAEIQENSVKQEDNTGKISAKIPKMKEVNTELKNQIDLVKELNDVNDDLLEGENEINQYLMERKANGLEDQFDDELEKQIEHTTKTGEIDKAALETLIEERAEILRTAAREQAAFDIAELKRQHALRMFEIRSQLEEEYQLKIAQEGITEEQKAKLKSQYDQQNRDIDAIEIQYEKVLNQQILDINLKTQGELDDIDKEAAEKKKETNEELLDAQKTYNDSKKKNEEDTNKGIEEAAKEHLERMKALADLLTDYLTKKSDERIALLEKEIDEAENQRDFLQDLAAQGNIQASQSLAEQNRIIAEANLKKEREERKKQKIALANSVYQTYASKVEADSKAPLSETIRDISLLNQFISTFTPTFKDGTEDTGKHGFGVDGQGGFHAILHPNERVLTKEQNQMVGDLSNTELASLAASYQAGTIINREGATQLGNGWNTQAVIKQLESLERTIKNKPEHKLEVENVVMGAMDIVRSTRTGGTTIYNRYRVKK